MAPVSWGGPEWSSNGVGIGVGGAHVLSTCYCEVHWSVDLADVQLGGRISLAATGLGKQSLRIRRGVHYV